MILFYWVLHFDYCNITHFGDMLIKYPKKYFEIWNSALKILFVPIGTIFKMKNYKMQI